MANSKMRVKQTLAQTMAKNRAAMRGLCDLAGKVPPAWTEEPAAPPPREKKPAAARPRPLENDVKLAISDLLARHPLVLFAVRQNSGMSYNASNIPIWFYRWARSREKMRISDFWGLLTDGRMFAIECKRPGWKKPTGDREIEQMNFLLTVKYAGGIGMFATDAQLVADALGGAV